MGRPCPQQCRLLGFFLELHTGEFAAKRFAQQVPQFVGCLRVAQSFGADSANAVARGIGEPDAGRVGEIRAQAVG
ncbi:hypothetical protein ADT25_14055 [Xanthomonas oryzae]|uniref:Uncharacterized protein n=1 Tax=Xanthomonas oryzae TaxID=347 RepID=A0AAP1EZ16_9XANT|nr:hypothetical protein ADT25_14055 [Xanthomonas oryzae]